MTVPPVLITVLVCLYLPVAPIMMLIHTLHARAPELGPRAYGIHVPVYIALVLAVAAAHPLWNHPVSTWPDGVRAMGGALVALSAMVLLWTYRQIDSATAMAIPQVTGRGSDRFIDHGIYARLRHPRYAVLLGGAAGNAMLVGSPALFVAAALTAFLVPILVRTEERELVNRFGATYEAYRAYVPALFPRARSRVQRVAPSRTDAHSRPHPNANR